MVTLLSILFSIHAWAGDFVEVYSGRSLYAEHVPAEPGQPTLILLNGMTYSTHQWDKFVSQFKEENPGVGVVTYDMFGMGETMKRYKRDFYPLNNTRISYEEQARELWLLIRALKIKGPIHIAGLSYGGGIAQYFMKEYGHHKQIKSAILMSPFIQPIQNQVSWIEQQIRFIRLTQPFNAWSDEQLYDYFLRILVYTTYPIAEPIILEHPLKAEATFRLAQGMKAFNGYEFVEDFPNKSIHLVVPLSDEYISQETFASYWEEVPKRSRASRLLIPGGRHKLPEEMPGLMVDWISRLIRDESGEYHKGKTFNSNELRLNKCDSALAI